MATGRSVVLQARYPADLRVVGRALGVNLSEAAVRGVVQAICSAAGITGHGTLSPDLEVALLSTLRSRRDEIAADLAELNEYITRIETLEGARQQALADQRLAAHQQAAAAAQHEAIRIARERFRALLPTVSESEIARLRNSLEDDNAGDVAAEIVDALVRKHALTLPPGVDPAQLLVDHVIETGGIA